jgi:hypothetical protein
MAAEICSNEPVRAVNALRRIAAGLAVLYGFAHAACAQAPGEPSAVIASDCDRACLIGFTHQYMDALTRHDPRRLPLARGARMTENDVEMPLGREGLWRSISGAATSGLELADPLTGNAAWLGVVEEHGAPAYFALRLRVIHQRIAEVETIVVRKGALPTAFGDPSQLVHDPAFAETLPPAQQRARERLVAVANGYFSTVELNDGAVLTLFDPDCQRTENGISTTRGTFGAAGIAQGCESQFKLGLYRINKRVRERRFPLIDVERGVVLATGFFDHANTFDSYTTTDGKSHRTALKWPNSISLMEAFKIRDGAIYRVEAVFAYVPYFMHSPWATVAPTREAAEDASESARPAKKSCDDACLGGLAEDYMRALVMHASDGLPWATRVRYSENSVGMMVGDALWGTASAATAPLIAADPASGNVAWFGTVAEHGEPAYYAMRLKIHDGRISEIESVVARRGNSGVFGKPQELTHDPEFTKPLPQGEHPSRASLNALIERYYDGASAPGAGGPLDPDCLRLTNGVPAPATALANGTEHIRERRILVVDVTRGVVVAAGFLDRPEPYLSAAPAESAAESPPRYPHSSGFMEVFKIRHGRIVRIESVSSLLPYLMPMPMPRSW